MSMETQLEKPSYQELKPSLNHPLFRSGYNFRIRSSAEGSYFFRKRIIEFVKIFSFVHLIFFLFLQVYLIFFIILNVNAGYLHHNNQYPNE